MSIHNQPRFWLRVRKEYITDNFDNLVAYLRAYTYSGMPDANPDYDATVKCMEELAEDYAERIRRTPLFSPLPDDLDVRQLIRLFMATVLARRKAGTTPHRLIASLAELLMKGEVKLGDKDLESVYAIVLSCILQRELSSTYFSWNDVANPDTSAELLALKFAGMKFIVSPTSPGRYLEHKGLLIVPPAAEPLIGIDNLARFSRLHADRQLSEQLSLPGLMKVEVSKKDWEKISDFETLYKATANLMTRQSQMVPSAEKKLKEYDMQDEFIIRITDKTGFKITAETVDPAYNKRAGKLQINMPDMRPDFYNVSSCLQPGVYLRAMLAEDDNYTFEIRDAFENFYRENAATYAGEKTLARYLCDYPNGKQFVTMEGVRVGIDKSKFSGLSEEMAEMVDDAITDKLPILIKFYVKAPDIKKEFFTIYADFDTQDPMIVSDPRDEDWFEIKDADRAMTEAFIASATTEAAEFETGSTQSALLKTEPELCYPLAAVIRRFLKEGVEDCGERLGYATCAAMICRIANHPEEYDFFEYERRFIYSEVEFARNRELTPPARPKTLEGVEEVDLKSRVIEILRGYKKKIPAKGTGRETPIISARENDIADKIGALVSASNNLIEIMDDSELNSIKLAIVRTLGVEDEYVSLLDERTFYGNESASLEFKMSAVFPPANRRRYASAVADPKIQQWAIIKAVCGFLNTRSGGELIIGVRDTGYACGLDDDMAALARAGLISAPEIDRYRTYLQCILDSAFKVSDSKILSSDIARSTITYLPETNAEGLTVMRIKILPYRDGIVELAASADERPQGIENSYLRLSGRTVPLTESLKRDISRYKTPPESGS